jgi:hypothetical protein
MFDMVAEDLKTLVYGLNGSTAVALAVDSSGNLNIGVGYTSANITVTDVATGSTGATLTLDSSEKNLYSYYVKNSSTEASIAVKLQVSPTDDSSFFIDDTPTAVTLGTDAATVLVPKNYLHYTRLCIRTPIPARRRTRLPSWLTTTRANKGGGQWRAGFRAPLT